MSPDLKEIPKINLHGNPVKTFFSFIRNPFLFLQDHALHPEGITQFRLLHHRIVHVSKPEHLKVLLQASPEIYTQSRDRDHMQLLFGNGLLTSAGKHWQKQRARMQPCFAKPNLEALFHKISRQLNRFPLPENTDFDLHAYSLNLINYIIADLVFSRTDSETLALGNLLVDLKADTLRRLRDFSLPLWVPTSQNLKFRQERKTVYQGIQKLIYGRENSANSETDLLVLFREAKDKETGEMMSEAELIEELLGVYAAAHEPVAIALSYTFYLISTNPETEAKLRKELQENLTDQELSVAQLHQLTYTKRVVQEALRIYPPVWISGKRALKSTDLNGFQIKKNDNFIYSPLILHRQPTLWNNANAFDPDRFLSLKAIDPFAYLPFGGGIKFCLGSHLAQLILQAAVAKIYSQYTLRTKVKEIEINPFATLKPLNAFTFQARKTV